MQNNFDPKVKAPIDKVYLYSPKLQFHQPVHNKLLNPLQQGSGSFAPLRHHNQQNPAINNWKPGTRIPEPNKIYEYSSALQLHSRPVDPIVIQPNRGHLIQGRLSDDDGKPFSQTQKYFDTFTHVSSNPLVYKN